MTSFRDPAGHLFTLDGRIVRVVHPSGGPDLQSFLNSTAAQAFAKTGRLVSTEILNPAEAQILLKDTEIQERWGTGEGKMFVEHEKVPFPSFPYEWPPEMLLEAGRLTLDLAEELLKEGFGLKDATPYNVLFRGPRSVFIDLLSFERRNPCDPTWLPYAQFVRTFLIPLLTQRTCGIPIHQILMTHRDGLSPEEAYHLSGWLQRWRPSFLTSVTIPTWLARQRNLDDRFLYEKKPLKNPEKARFILRCLFKDLRHSLDRSAPKGSPGSFWLSYMDSNESDSKVRFLEKCSFVERLLDMFHPQRILDVGCNTGHFSLLGARRGAQVVAIDSDPAVIGQLWRKAHSEELDILPLVVDFARPSPGVGWRNQEHPSFLDRARGSFDLVLMLAFLHHLMANDGIPLSEILSLMAELTTEWLVIEWVSPEDPMFRRLTRGRDALFASLTAEFFETACQRHFEIIQSESLTQRCRRLYLLRKRYPHASS